MDQFSQISAPMQYSIAAGAYTVTNAIKTNAATAVTPQNFTSGNFNGADGAKLINGEGPARTLSVTTAASVGTYRTGGGFPIVLTGTFAGKTVTENLLLTAANGSETIQGVQPFDTLVSIAIPGQVDVNGGFSFGVNHVYCSKGQPFRCVKAHADGTIKIRQLSRTGAAGFGTYFDTDLVAVKGVIEYVAVYAVLSTTSIGVTVYE